MIHKKKESASSACSDRSRCLNPASPSQAGWWWWSVKACGQRFLLRFHFPSRVASSSVWRSIKLDRRHTTMATVGLSPLRLFSHFDSIPELRKWERETPVPLLGGSLHPGDLQQNQGLYKASVSFNSDFLFCGPPLLPSTFSPATAWLKNIYILAYQMTLTKWLVEHLAAKEPEISLWIKSEPREERIHILTYSSTKWLDSES